MKFLNFIICDEVRREDNGKLIIIGIYPNNIVLSRAPATIPIGMWAQFEAPKKTRTRIEHRVHDEKRNVDLFGGEGDMVVSSTRGTVAIPFPAVLVHIEGPTTLLFQFREKGKRWQTVRRMPVEVRPSSDTSEEPNSTTASPQPS